MFEEHSLPSSSISSSISNNSFAKPLFCEPVDRPSSDAHLPIPSNIFSPSLVSLSDFSFLLPFFSNCLLSDPKCPLVTPQLLILFPPILKF